MVGNFLFNNLPSAGNELPNENNAKNTIANKENIFKFIF